MAARSGNTSQRVVRITAFVSIATGVVVAAMTMAAPAGKAGPGAHMDELVALNTKFTGAGTCAGSSCHGGGSKEAPPKKIGSEFSIWESKDAHAKAATSLADAKVKKANPWLDTIGGKLGIKGDLATAKECVSCHAVEVPAALQGEKFKATEGVSCYQCHGPAEKWLVPHATKGWANAERAKLDHAGLLKTHSLFDTKPAVKRAEMCASCHLAIDAPLVAAGHPQPIFEQLTYQYEEPEHWIETNEGFGRLNLWAAGQVVGMREAMLQLAQRAATGNVAGAYEQAMAHLQMVQVMTDADVLKSKKAEVTALADKLKAAKAAPADLVAPANEAAALAPDLLAEVDKWPAKGDKATITAVLNKLTTLDATAIEANGRHGMQQVFFALERLLTGYRDGANISRDDFKAVRDSLKPLRDLKLFEKRFDATAPDTKALAPTLKAVDEKVKALK